MGQQKRQEQQCNERSNECHDGVVTPLAMQPIVGSRVLPHQCRILEEIVRRAIVMCAKRTRGAGGFPSLRECFQTVGNGRGIYPHS